MVDDTFCKTILTSSEASQISGVSIKYETPIAPTLNGSFLGACDYGISPLGADIFIAFLPGSDVVALNAEKDFINTPPGTVTAVAGVGGGAFAIFTPKQSGGKSYHLLVLDGPFIVHIDVTTSVPDDATGIDHLKQIAQIAMSRF
jgi:hypothetical protein